MKIRKCCKNCKHYECWDEEDGDYGCGLYFNENINKAGLDGGWNGYEKNSCKHYKFDVERLSEVYVIDEELKQDD